MNGMAARDGHLFGHHFQGRKTCSVDHITVGQEIVTLWKLPKSTLKKEDQLRRNENKKSEKGDLL